MIGMGMRHSIPLVSICEEGDEVNAVEEANKLTASEWLVDSQASLHVTNSKEAHSEPKATNQTVTIRRAR